MASLIRQLKLDWSSRLFLPHRCAIHRIPFGATSSTLTATTSQPRSLLSMAKLNRARSRIRPSTSNRVLIDQTCFGRSGGLAPISLPLFQGVRYEDGEHAPPARKVEKDFGFQRVAVIAML